jgi:ribose transport system substrate-binding protein
MWKSTGSSLRGSRFPLLASVVAGALLIGGCGGSSSGDAGAGTGVAAGAGGRDVAEAQQIVDRARGAVSFVSPGPAFDIAALRGKTVWIVCQDTSLPFVQAVFSGFTAAAGEAGLTVRIYDAKNQSNGAAKGIEQAVGAGADAIVSFGVTFRFVSNAVKTAEKAGIPVIGALNVDVHDPLEEGAAGEVSIDYAGSGRMLAAFAIATTDGPVHASYQHLPGIDTFRALKSGIESGFSELCDDCSVRSDDFLGDFKTQAQTKTAAAIARDPKLNWIFPGVDGLAQFTVPAVETSGKRDKIQVGSINAFTGNLSFIQRGRVQSVDVGNHNRWFGWAMVDRTLRALDGQPPAISEVPVKLFDRDNLAGRDVTDEDALFDGVDYQAEYRKLWR